MAALYLLHSLKGAGEAKGLVVRFLEREEELLDDRHLLRILLDFRPDIVCCTLYLWNVERTLHILRMARKAHPTLRMILGGPEIDFHHPFLFKSLVPDVAVVGEGEGVFAQIVGALCSDKRTNFATVGWKKGHRYEWGKSRVHALDLGDCMPPPEDPFWIPDENGTGYLETGRGCPLSCTYCRYPHLRRRMSFLSPMEVTERVRVLSDHGAREIRFVDPMLNANPHFGLILKSLAGMNGSSSVRFFAELRAETLAPDEIGLLAKAGFGQIEAGVQSLNPHVLHLVRRPARRVRLEENLRRMISEGLEVTIDLMYGLPGQGTEDIVESIQWARGLSPAYVQCLQTLLLPGTRLRRERRRWRICSTPFPPYGVRSTDSLSWEEIRWIEERIHEISPADCMTNNFVGYSISDLFEEKIVFDLDRMTEVRPIAGSSSRRAVLLRGGNLFAARKLILKIVREAISTEPHILWQFVLNPSEEIPLDLLEEMTAGIHDFPTQWVDRFASVAAWNRIASRRIFILLKRGCHYATSWMEAARSFLSDHFY